MSKLLAFVAITLGAFGLSTTASAHTPDITYDCYELRVNLTRYEGPADNNVVTVTIDGVPRGFTFGRSFSNTFPLDPTVPHSGVVEVDANIHRGDPDRYDASFPFETYACEYPTTTTPETTTTWPATTTPTTTPSTSSSTTEPAPTTTAPESTSTSTTTTTSSSPPSTSPTSAPTSPPSSAPGSSAPSSTTSVPPTSGVTTTTEPGLPVTGSTRTIPALALMALGAGGLLVAVSRRRSRA